MKRPFKTFIYISFFVYVLLMISILFFRNRYADGLSISEYMARFSNFVPFKTIKMYITCFFDGKINRSIVYRNILGNLILFMPLGVFLYINFPKMKNMLANLSVVFVCIAITEIVQLLFKIGSIDIDDIILNMIGAFLGFLIVNIEPIKNFIERNL